MRSVWPALMVARKAPARVLANGRPGSFSSRYRTERGKGSAASRTPGAHADTNAPQNTTSLTPAPILLDIVPSRPHHTAIERPLLVAALRVVATNQTTRMHGTPSHVFQHRVSRVHQLTV